MIMSHSSSARRAADRAFYAMLLARYARKRRAELDLTAEEAAELSGLAVSEWCALETGWVPNDMNVIRTIAATLWIRWTDLSLLAFIARGGNEAA